MQWLLDITFYVWLHTFCFLVSFCMIGFSICCFLIRFCLLLIQRDSLPWGWYCIRKIELKKSNINGSIFLKNWHFLLKKDSINWNIVLITIIICGIWQRVKFQLVSHFWTGSKMKWFFYHISELMLATLIQRYDKKSLYFWSSSRLRDYCPFDIILKDIFCLAFYLKWK